MLWRLVLRSIDLRRILSRSHSLRQYFSIADCLAMLADETFVIRFWRVLANFQFAQETKMQGVATMLTCSQ